MKTDSAKHTYRLIAFDMDGTLLNSGKKISQHTIDAIEQAFAAGKEVVLSTGRCIPELEEYFQMIPRLRYAVCVSGALVYDYQKRQTLYSNPITVPTVRQILAQVRQEDIMVHFLTTESIVEQNHLNHMNDYQMGVYQPMFQKITKRVENIHAYFEQNPVPIEKINLYHRNKEEREKTRERLKNLNLVLADSEVSSLECSAKGVTKGTGLKKLCEILGINLKDTIAVGDADNDIDVLKTAGLSIAMGNANDMVKSICDVTVNDCDHDGCAQAIKQYLL